MNGSKKNIEELFKSKFNGHKVEPSPFMWNKIDSRLNKLSFNYYVNSLFNNVKISPASKNWTIISAKLFLLNFLKFSPFRFNVYYLSSITALLVLLYTFNFNDEGIDNFIVQNNINSEAFIDFTPEISIEQNDVLSNYDLIPTLRTIPISNKALETNNKNNFYSIDSSIEKKKEEFYEIKDVENIYRDESVKQLSIIDNFYFEKNIQQSEIAYYDTLGTNVFGDPILLKPNIYSLDFFLSYSNNQSLPYTLNNELVNYCKVRSSYESALNTVSAGINFNYQSNRIIYQTGLYFTQFGEKFNYYNTYNNVDSVSRHLYQSGSKFNIDSTLSISVDSLNALDTSYYYTYNVVWNNVYDTLMLYHVDSLKEKKLSYRNKYRYIEVPLILGYQTTIRNFTFGLKGGVIAGMFINSSGRTLDYYDYSKTQDINTSMPNVLPHFTSYFAVSVDYKINNNLSAIFEPYYRHSLYSMYSKLNPINQKFYVYGTKLGLRYEF